MVALCGHMDSPSVFGVVRVAHLFCFLCCGRCFLCLRPVSYVFDVLRFSGLSIIYSHLRLKHFTNTGKTNQLRNANAT